MEKSILQEAQELVYGDRAKAYGDFVQNMNDIAAIAGAILGKKFLGSDIAMILHSTKLGREKNGYKRDDCVDGCGYLDGYSRCKEAEHGSRN